MADDEMAMAGAENATEHHHQCLFWNISFGALFHTGNVLVATGFVIPQSYAYSLISYRAVMVIGRARLPTQKLFTLYSTVFCTI